MLKDEYFKMKGYNFSSLSNFLDSPAYYKYCLDNPTPPTKNMGIGSAFHYLCFEPENIWKYMFLLDETKRPVPGSDYRNIENKEWRKKELESAGDREIISSDDYQVAQDMYASIQKNKEAWEILRYKENVYEKASQWEWNGMLFKRKVDFSCPLFMGDVKSCENPNPKYFARKIFDWEYDFQGGMYSDGERIIEDSEFFKDYYIIAVGNKPPHLSSVLQLTDEVLDYGCSKYRSAALGVRECEKKGEWPAYPGLNQVYLPKYLKEV